MIRFPAMIPALRVCAVIILAGGMCRAGYDLAAPYLQYGLVPNLGFALRFFLTRLSDAIFAPLILLAFAALLEIKKGSTPC